METSHVLAWITRTSCYYFYSLFNDEIHNVVRKRRQEHDINTERTVCQRLNLVNISFHHFLRRISATDDPETTSL